MTGEKAMFRKTLAALAASFWSAPASCRMMRLRVGAVGGFRGGGFRGAVGAVAWRSRIRRRRTRLWISSDTRPPDSTHRGSQRRLAWPTGRPPAPSQPEPTATTAATTTAAIRTVTAIRSARSLSLLSDNRPGERCSARLAAAAFQRRLQANVAWNNLSEDQV